MQLEELRSKQHAFEEQSDNEAAAAKLAELRSSSAEGSLEHPKAQHLIARAYLSVEEHLKEQQAQVARGASAKYKNWLRSIPTDVAAVIALRSVIRTCLLQTKVTTLQTLASNIGKYWELEIRIREAEAVNPVYMQRIHDQVKANCTTSTAHLRKLYNVAYDRVMKGEIDSSLTEAEMVQLGKFGVQACMDAGILESRRGTFSGGTLVAFDLTAPVLEFLTHYSESDVRTIMDRAAGAMLCPPDAWTNLHDGGYLTPRRKALSPMMSFKHVRRSERQRLRDSFTAEKMPIVFEAGNYMQSQAFALHGPTMAAIRRVWDAGGGVLGVPVKTPPKRPECPFPPEWVKDDAPASELDVFNRWKREAMHHYAEMRTWRGKVREIAGFYKATNNCGDGPVWFPMYVDKRGRWYYRGTPNPQGSDLAKAVLHFHEKKPLTARGVFWLKVHIANTFGFDKERFVDRAAWTEQHWADIERALDEPENCAAIWGTDAPWGMYSAAWELREAYRSGNPNTYRTGIVVHMDATCSGLQHFSALLRDPVGARYVNLIDEAKCGPKQDIYAHTAVNSMEAMKRDLSGFDAEVKGMSEWWMQNGIPRGLAKKPVMTYVYGATLRGTCDFVQTYVENETSWAWPDESKSYLYSQYAAKKLFQGIAATVPSAEYAMQWLRGVAREQPKGKRMEWRSPTGFLVQHDYQAFVDKKVFIRSCGLHAVLVRESTEDTRPVQMQNAIAPNFVHALDAAHITFTALGMKNAGLSMVGIHDSFGTHACDVDTLHSETRKAFHNMYSKGNILGEFMWDVGYVGEMPMRGNFDLTQVLDSEFFFC